MRRIKFILSLFYHVDVDGIITGATSHRMTLKTEPRLTRETASRGSIINYGIFLLVQHRAKSTSHRTADRPRNSVRSPILSLHREFYPMSSLACPIFTRGGFSEAIDRETACSDENRDMKLLQCRDKWYLTLAVLPAFIDQRRFSIAQTHLSRSRTAERRPVPPD